MKFLQTTCRVCGEKKGLFSKCKSVQCNYVDGMGQNGVDFSSTKRMGKKKGSSPFINAEIKKIRRERESENIKNILGVAMEDAFAGDVVTVDTGRGTIIIPCTKDVEVGEAIFLDDNKKTVDNMIKVQDRAGFDIPNGGFSVNEIMVARALGVDMAPVSKFTVEDT